MDARQSRTIADHFNLTNSEKYKTEQDIRERIDVIASAGKYMLRCTKNSFQDPEVRIYVEESLRGSNYRTEYDHSEPRDSDGNDVWTITVQW